MSTKRVSKKETRKTREPSTIPLVIDIENMHYFFAGELTRDEYNYPVYRGYIIDDIQVKENKPIGTRYILIGNNTLITESEYNK